VRPDGRPFSLATDGFLGAAPQRLRFATMSRRAVLEQHPNPQAASRFARASMARPGLTLASPAFLGLCARWQARALGRPGRARGASPAVAPSPVAFPLAGQRRLALRYPPGSAPLAIPAADGSWPGPSPLPWPSLYAELSPERCRSGRGQWRTPHHALSGRKVEVAPDRGAASPTALHGAAGSKMQLVSAARGGAVRVMKVAFLVGLGIPNFSPRSLPDLCTQRSSRARAVSASMARRQPDIAGGWTGRRLPGA